MCNNNFDDNWGSPYSRSPNIYAPSWPPIGFNNNRGCDCGYGNVFGLSARSVDMPPTHIEAYRDRNRTRNHRYNSIRFREFEQDFEDDSSFERTNDDREWERGYQPIQSLALPFGDPYFNAPYLDSPFAASGYGNDNGYNNR